MGVGVSPAGAEFGMVQRHLSNVSPGIHGVDYLYNLVQWLVQNEAHGILGEVGVPLGDRRWVALMTDLSRNAERHNIPLVVWAAGEWWGDYPLSIQSLLKPGKPTALESLGLADVIEATR